MKAYLDWFHDVDIVAVLQKVPPEAHMGAGMHYHCAVAQQLLLEA